MDDMQTAIMEEAIKILKRRLQEYEQDWKPINYDDADSGKGCFDAKPWMLEVIDPDNGVVMFYIEGTWYSDFNVWYTTMGTFETDRVKRYRPIPQGWLEGGRK